jgi:uncharacterized damage-inducible protein DinB
MKEILQQCTAYTIWANQKIFDWIANLSEEQIDQEITSSFSSLRKTIVHMWDAEAAWYQRLKLVEKIEVPSAAFTGNFAELVKKVNQQSLTWKEWVDHATEVQLQHVFAYQNSKKEQFKQPVYEMLLHIFNHGTYHRGQLVTMLRQLGVDKIPQTDFIVFCRKK